VAATTGKTAAAATTFTGNEVIEAYQSVSAQYRPGLKAVISQAGESLLSRLTDDNGMYIWRQGLAAGNPDTLCGVPLGTDPQGPALTTGLKPLVFYNPTNFHVRNCMNGRVFYDVSTEAQFTQFNRVIRIAKWIDCDAGDAGGCKSLTLA
jgi:HK97 family phage major capsid protein